MNAKIVMMIVLAGVQMVSLGSEAATKIHCISNDLNQEVQFVFGHIDVSAELPLTEQKFQGSFESHYGPADTRLAGIEIRNIAVHSKLPDYGRPHTIDAQLIYDPPEISGSVVIKGVTGNVQQEFGVTCSEVGADGTAFLGP